MQDVHEQHELESLKSWWKSNGMAVITGSVIAISAILGWQGYHSYQQANHEAASSRFESLRSAAAQNNFAAVSTDAKQLMVDQPDSPYAVGAAFLLAKHAVEKADWVDAQANLQWILTHSQESHWRAVAALRLARVLVEANKADEAIALLAKETPSMSEAFKGLSDYTRGMALLQQGNQAAAQTAFASAQANPAVSTSIRSLSQLWIDDLGQVAP